MWLDITMDEIALSKELQGTGQLFEEVTDDDLVEGTSSRIWIFGHHIASIPMGSEAISTLDEHGQVP